MNEIHQIDINIKFVKIISLDIRGDSGQHVAERGQRQAAATGDKDGRRITRPLDAEERAAQLVAVKVITAIVGRGRMGIGRHRRANILHR